MGDRLHSVAIHLLRWLRREDEASGLSASRLSALSVVVFAGPLPLGALARAEQVRPPSMTRIVAALEAAGLVTRRSHERDARSVEIVATARGRRLLMRGRLRRVTRLASALERLAPGELAAVERAVAILRRVLDAERHR